MPKLKKRYICQSCGQAYARWQGQCYNCKAWETIVEEVIAPPAPQGLLGAAYKKVGQSSVGGQIIPLEGLKVSPRAYDRFVSGIGEFDRVTGGGLVAGGCVLFSGDPGIGKSTLLLQISSRLALQGYQCVYISAEEVRDQVALRAARLGFKEAPLQLAEASSVRDIVHTVMSLESLDVLVIDSIQTVYMDTIDTTPGTVTQMRASAQELIRLAKRKGCALILIGHVTKDGTIAGPRVMEHMVDVILYLEGDRTHQFRLLKGVKNRFGATDEVGIFEMASEGMIEVQNPSAFFLTQQKTDVSGRGLFAMMEGTRSMLVEIQALLVSAAYGVPRRSSVGWDVNRLAMIMAVLEARGGIALSQRDVYVSVTGGLRINDPAADLAVMAVLISAYTNKPLPPQSVFFGEVGLSGEIYPVRYTDLRLKESLHLGLEHFFIPRSRHGNTVKDFKEKYKEAAIFHEISTIWELLATLQENAGSP